MTTVLGLTTATATTGVALWRDGVCLAADRRLLQRGQTIVLMPMVMALVDMVGRTDGRSGQAVLAGVDRFAVCIGPGSFTGLRVGLAAARGLALATGRLATGVTSLEAIAHTVVAEQEGRRGSRLLVVIESGREAMFAQGFDDRARPLGAPWIAPPDQLAAWLQSEPNTLVAGTAANRLRACLVDRRADRALCLDRECDPEVIARLGADPDRQRLAEPLYLRAPDARPIDRSGTGTPR